MSAAAGRSPNDLLSEPIGADGKIGPYRDSPLHTSSGFIHPVRVSPDGTIVILGSGLVHDAETLARQVAGLGNAVSDIAWLNGTVYSVRSISGYAQFQQWTGSTFAPGAVAQVAGTPLRLLSIDDAKLVGIYQATAGGVPQFRVMDGNFQPIAAPTPAWLAPGSAATWNPSTKSLTVTGAATITFDPGPDVLISASGAAAVLTIDPSGATPRVNVGTLTLAEGARATLVDATADRVLVVHGAAGLNVTGASTLDLGDNDLILNYSSVSPLGTWNGSAYDGVTSLIRAGRIIASAADEMIDRLGVAEAREALDLAAGQTALWNGLPVDSSTVLVMYSYAGDANLDGFVSGDDYTAIDFAIAQPGAFGYANGDFNLDGIISGDDYTIIDFNIAAQGAPLGAAAAAAAAGSSSSSVWSASPTEPALAWPAAMSLYQEIEEVESSGAELDKLLLS